MTPPTLLVTLLAAADEVDDLELIARAYDDAFPVWLAHDGAVVLDGDPIGGELEKFEKGSNVQVFWNLAGRAVDDDLDQARPSYASRT